MNFSQFIHGKTTNGRNYDLVALTADLAGREDELERIAQKYRFWGSQPPVDNPIAVGVFHHGDNLLLVQAMQAAYANGRLAADVQGRPYTQHRYVFIPLEALDGLDGRLWLLLNWIMETTRGIPTFDRMDRGLAPLPAPVINGHWFNPTDERDKLTRSLSLKDRAGHPVLLSVLSALVNRKRVVFDAAATSDIFSEDLLEGTLLLLPAACRSQISVAAGALDERVCTRANLMVRTNGTPNGPLSDDLVWAKRANNQFYGAIENGTLESGYAKLIEPIISGADSLNILLRILDDLETVGNSGEAGAWRALNNGWLTPHLIPAMPDPERRAKYWRSALKNISSAEWEAILPSIIDETGLEIAWAELQRQVKRHPTDFAPLVFDLWRSFSADYIRYTLREELSADLKLAEALIANGLLTHLNREHRADVFDLCEAVIAAKASRNRREASELVRLVLREGGFDNAAEQFALQEALLSRKISRADLLEAFNDLLVPTLPTLTPDDLAESRIYRALVKLTPDIAALVDKLVTQNSRALASLPKIAAASEMSLAQRRDLVSVCVAGWQAAWSSALPLLTDLVTQWIAEYPPENRPHLATVFDGMDKWLSRNAPESVHPLLTVTGAEFAFEDWQTLAHTFFSDELGRVSFMDHVTVGEPVQPMVACWLRVVAEDGAATDRFEASYTWHHLQDDGPTWLSDGVSQLLGWEKAGFSALLPLLERLQSTLGVSQTDLFKLLGRLPGSGDDDVGLMLAAYLPQLAAGKNGDVESLPAWQMLNAQAPKVAGVYKILAEGQKNPALDKFNQLKLNAALTEAPEHAAALAHWLQLCGKGNWLAGKLLETLLEQWHAHPETIDPLLLARLLQPELAEKYAFADWLALAKICWRPDYLSLWPDGNQPSLTSRQRSQVIAVASSVARQYVSAGQASQLLSACRHWNLPESALLELAGDFPPEICNFKLLHPYLYSDGTVIKPNDHTSQKILSLAMQLNPADILEQAQYKLFLTRLLTDQLQGERGVLFFTAWNQVIVDRKVFNQALSAAVTDMAPQHFSLMLNRAHQLSEQGVTDLSQTVVSALDAYWADQKRKLSQ